VVWRCHIGVDEQNDASRAAWEFLRPHLTAAHAYVFSRRQYVPEWIQSGKVWIIAPSIDPLSAKNQELDPAAVQAILSTVGLLDADAPSAPARFTRLDGTTGEVTRAALVIGDRKLSADEQVVVQVSRWDKLKDMVGVMRGFAEHVAPSGGGSLVLAGPASGGVADDPEGPGVYADCRTLWTDLPADIRARVLLVSLPLDDLEENAAMVNALQRHAAVVVQKSLAEGFGLTVAEAMWKARPVIGSAVGGIQDQIADGTGVLLRDPADLATFGAQLRCLLDDRDDAERMALAGQAHAGEHYLVDRHLEQLGELFQTALID
jgi:trehalose synthase